MLSDAGESLEEGVLLAVGEAAGQNVVDRGGVDLDGADGDLPTPVGQADDDRAAVISGGEALEEAALDKTGHEAAERRLAERDGPGQIVHAHLIAIVKVEVEQDVEIADRQAALPAQLGRQLPLDPVMGEAKGVPGPRAFVVFRLSTLVFGFSSFVFGFSFPQPLTLHPQLSQLASGPRC